jgi:hypothetical protein
MKIRIIALCFFVLAIFNSCKTDLDILASYKAIPVIYGIINPKETTHYIRVQKAFLGQGDAYTFSQVADSNYFKNITVKLIPFFIKDNGDTTFKSPKEIVLYDTIIQTKESGVFFAQGQKLYITHAKLDSTFSLLLKVINNENGQIYSAFTPLIDKVNFLTPNSSPSSVVSFASSLANYTPYTPQWNMGNNGYYNELFLNFFYRSVVNIAGTKDTIAKRITWKQATKIRDLTATSGGGTIATGIDGEQFYKYIKQTIPTSGDTLFRIFDGVSFSVDVAGLEFYNYLTLNQPTSTVVQDKPIYGNIKGGYGIFSTRRHTESTLKQFTSSAKKELVEGQYTQYLQFK